MELRILVGMVCVPLLASASDLAEQAHTILKENCHVCHGAALQQSGLDLRTRERILLGGERGAAVTAASLSRSWLWRLVNHQVKPFMPPTGKLGPEKIEVLRKWILAGAPMPDSATSDEEAERLEALRLLEERPITDEERAWWAFVPPERPVVPSTGDPNPIDAFLDRKLAAEGLQKNGPADKRTLIRRVYLDLVGLPPTPEETEAFLNDDSENSWESLVERLLESPHYGERWGRHWLDLVHYADSGGFERDFDWPTMWRYRDYVIDAFNNDKPYDQFIIEQIAGDEVNPDSVEANIATGYLRMVLDNNIKDERTRMDELDDNVATTSQAFLAMTVQLRPMPQPQVRFPSPRRTTTRCRRCSSPRKRSTIPWSVPKAVARHEAALTAIQQQQKPLRARMTKTGEASPGIPIPSQTRYVPALLPDGMGDTRGEAECRTAPQCPTGCGTLQPDQARRHPQENVGTGNSPNSRRSKRVSRS